MKRKHARNQFMSRNGLRRPGFTLIELMVVISIIIILLTITLAAVDLNREGDRVRSGGSRVQSFLRGARDRAIFRKEPVGVRLFLDQAPPGVTGTDAELYTRTVTMLAYISVGGTWGAPGESSGVSLERIDYNGDGDFLDVDTSVTPNLDDSEIRIVHGFNNPGWWNLKRRGWLVDDMRIRIPAGPGGNWYPIDTSRIDITVPPTNDQLLFLKIPYADPGDNSGQIAWTDRTYELELPWQVIPEEPMILPDGVVIDLDASKLPSSWRPGKSGNARYSGYMDIVFSPRGTIIDDAAGAGILHLMVGDAEDSRFLKEKFIGATSLAAFNTAVGNGSAFVPLDEIDSTVATWMGAGETYISKDRRVVSIFAQTGDVHISLPNAFQGSSASSNEIANDPFFFAETGEVVP